jgi:hypothetical protein
MGDVVANHRKHAAGAPRSEAAAIISKHVALRRTGLVTVAGVPLVTTLAEPPAEPADDTEFMLGGQRANRHSFAARGRVVRHDEKHRPGSDAATGVSGDGTGSASVPKGRSTETVSVSGMTLDSLVLVTLQSVNSGVHVLGAVPAHGEFTVHLSKKAPQATKFAWSVLNR